MSDPQNKDAISSEEKIIPEDKQSNGQNGMHDFFFNEL